MDYGYSFDTVDTVHGSVETSVSNMVDRNLHILHPRTASSAQNGHCRPSLAEQLRQTRRSATECGSDQDRETGNRSSMCIERSFDVESAKLFVHSLANPCHPALSGSSKADWKVSAYLSQNHPLSHMFGEIPATPPTSSGSSSSDESQSENESTAADKLPTPTRCSAKGERIGERKGEFEFNKGQKFVKSPKRHVHTADNANERMGLECISPPPRDGNLVVLVGDQRYLLPSSSMGLASKYVMEQKRVAADGHAIVDLSTHSLEEWNVVLGFLKPAADSRGINWSNLPIVLPWFVEFQSLTLMSQVDSFLLQNLLGGRRDASQGRFISFPNLLKLTKVAMVCGLETTKMQARRVLRQGLLQPRKAPVQVGFAEGGSDEQEDIELEWTLDDLQVLTRMMECFDELREYLWECAVIVYLPHDLDVSDSLVLVSNPLFPYLLREGMMQMMIVEGLDTPSSTIKEPASLNRKLQNHIHGSSGSIGSDTTIPTNPASGFVKPESQEEVQQHLHRMIQHLEKFQVEKGLRSMKQQQLDTSEGSSFDEGPRSLGNRRRKTLKESPPRVSANISRRPSKSKAETFAC